MLAAIAGLAVGAWPFLPPAGRRPAAFVILGIVAYALIASVRLRARSAAPSPVAPPPSS